jgi:hypothetical protein
MHLETLGATECTEMARHLSSCARCARTLEDLELAGSAYAHAFAKLRSRRTHIAAGRARLAAATERRAGLAFTIPAHLLRLRLAESALAFGVMTLAVVGSFSIEPSRAITPPEPAVVVATPVAAPQPEDPLRLRAARLRYGDVSVDLGDMVFRVTPGTPY